MPALNRALAKGLMFVSCLVMLAMVLQIVVDVALRFLFDVQVVGTIEIVSTWYMVALAFLPLAYVQWRREHLIVEVFTQGVSARALRLLDTAIYAICLGVLVLYIWQAAVAAMGKTEIAESLETAWFEIPVWPTRWFLPLGLGAMAVCMLTQILTGMRPEPGPAIPREDV